MTGYTLHMELADGTFEDAFHSVATKADAIRAARRCAKSAGPDVVNVVVCQGDQFIFQAATGRRFGG